VPFSHGLIAALPKAMREQVAAFHPAGRFDIDTTLTRDPDNGSIHHVSRVRPQDASVTHERFPVEVRSLEGTLVIDADVVRLEQLRGRLGDAEVSAVGAIVQTRGDRRIDVDLVGRGVAVNDALLAACPPTLRRTLSTWRVEGPLDAAVHLSETKDGTLTARTEASLPGVRIHHDRFPLPFTDVHGRVTVDADGVHASGLT